MSPEAAETLRVALGGPLAPLRSAGNPFHYALTLAPRPATILEVFFGEGAGATTVLPTPEPQPVATPRSL